MKMESMSIKEFMNMEKEHDSFPVKVEKHFKKYGLVYKVAGISVLILTTGSLAFAMDPSVLASVTGIEPQAKILYRQLVGLGKWAIIFKGGFDTIKSIGNGDFGSAKKSFFSYLFTYLFLLALPFGMDKVDEIFKTLNP